MRCGAPPNCLCIHIWLKNHFHACHAFSFPVQPWESPTWIPAELVLPAWPSSWPKALHVPRPPLPKFVQCASSRRAPSPAPPTSRLPGRRQASRRFNAASSSRAAVANTSGLPRSKLASEAFTSYGVPSSPISIDCSTGGLRSQTVQEKPCGHLVAINIGHWLP